MRDFGKSRHGSAALAVAVAGALLLSSTSAFAALDKCQAKIEGEGKKLRDAIYGALVKCKDAAQKENVKGIVSGLGTSCQPGGGCMPTAAHACEIQLSKVYDVLGVLSPPTKIPGASKVDKFRSAIEKLRQPNGSGAQTCTDADIDINTGLNHLLSGTGTHAGGPPASDSPVDTDGDLKADPNGHATFMTDWLLFAIEKVVIKQQLFQIPVMLNLLSDMATTGPGPIVLPAGTAAKKGTSCSSAFNVNTEEYRPNLCRFGVECRDHACTINQTGKCCTTATCSGGTMAACDPFAPPSCASGNSCVPQNSYGQLESAPLDSTATLGPQRLALGGRLITEICRPGKVSGTCKGNAAVCSRDADCASGQGPCNMFPGLGAGAAFGTQSNFLYLINEPSRSLKVPQPPPLPAPFSGLITAACIEIVRSEGWCDCDGAAPSSHVNITTCQDHIATTQVTDDCGQTTDVSNEDSTFPGTVNGKLTVQTSGSSVAGDCVDLLTVSAKIITATSDLGPDLVACTDDDFAAPIDPLSVPGTTGVSDAQIKDAVENAGNCTGGGSGNCIENANCTKCDSGLCHVGGAACTTDAQCAAGGTCAGPLSILPIFSQGPVTGGKTDCNSYLASNLSGLAFVGAAPILNGPSPLGDATIEVKISCQ